MLSGTRERCHARHYPLDRTEDISRDLSPEMFYFFQICILDIEMNGVRSVKKSYLNEHTAFVMIVPPSFEELERRLRGRGKALPFFPSFSSFSLPFSFSLSHSEIFILISVGDTSEEAMAARLATAKIELSMQDEKDFWSYILVNDTVDESKKRLEHFIFSAFPM
jgi:guanylate kinase